MAGFLSPAIWFGLAASGAAAPEILDAARAFDIGFESRTLSVAESRALSVAAENRVVTLH